MPSAEAEITTTRASRYLVQLCKHASAIGAGHGPGAHSAHASGGGDVRVHAEWSDTEGVLTFPARGQCRLTAEPAVLRVRIDADDDAGVRLIRDILTNDLGRIGRRDGLTLRWST